jgi:hypothetical protein
MEITYDMIIKYLVKNGKEQENILTRKNFLTRKSIYNYSTNFPEKFRDLLSDKFYRFGITAYDQEKEKNNVSFWSSLLTLLDKKFLMPYNMDETTLINIAKEQLLELYSLSQIKSKFKLCSDKNELRERFRLEVDLCILQYIADVMDINLLIFDFETNDINVVYKNTMLNPWKPTLLFAKYDNLWEPILMVKSKGDIQRTFDYNNIYIKKILLNTDNMTYYKSPPDMNFEKEIICMDYISDVVQMELVKIQEKIGIVMDPNDSDSGSSVKTDDMDEDTNLFTSIDIIKLPKMKVAELTEIATKLKITLPKRATKAVIIDMITKTQK